MPGRGIGKVDSWLRASIPKGRVNAHRLKPVRPVAIWHPELNLLYQSIFVYMVCFLLVTSGL